MTWPRASKISAMASYWIARAASRPSPKDHIFVVGVPRSGTSLVQTRLAEHPSILSIEGETAFFRPLIFSKEKGFLNESHKRAFHSSTAISLTKRFDDYAEFLCPNGVRSLEKTPQHILSLAWMLKSFPNSHIVHVYRNPLDAFASAQDNQNVPQGRSAAAFSYYYRRCIRNKLRAGFQGKKIIDVPYERFVSEPEETLAFLMDCLGKKIHKRQLGAVKDHRSISRAHKKLASKPSSASIGMWRVRISGSDADLVRAKCIPLYEKLCGIAGKKAPISYRRA